MHRVRLRRFNFFPFHSIKHLLQKITFRIGRSGINLFDTKKIIFFLWIFLLVFPKGGIKIGETPITWGYLGLGFFSLVACFKRLNLNLSHLHALLLLFPFQFIFFYSLLFNGIETTSFSTSLTMSFLFIPITFLGTFSRFIEKMNLEYFYFLLRAGIFIICCYGIFLFFYKMKTGNLIEIPFLTINYHDIGLIEFKCNKRKNVFKLISTFNNGNIFGVSILIFLPLYCYLEKNLLKSSIAKLSLILTFSRTVWIGLILHQVLFNLFIKKTNPLKTFVKTLIAALFIFSISSYFDISSSFFFDKEFGGRISHFDFLKTCSFFPNKPFWGIVEISYLGVLDQFGILGLITFLIAMLGPLLLGFTRYKSFSPIRASLFLGLFIYLLVSCSDAALLYIPVMAFYWFCSSLALRKDLDTHIQLSNSRNP